MKYLGFGVKRSKDQRSRSQHDQALQAVACVEFVFTLNGVEFPDLKKGMRKINLWSYVWISVTGSNPSADRCHQDSKADEDERPTTVYDVVYETGSDVTEDGVTSQYDAQSGCRSACNSRQYRQHKDCRLVMM